MIQDIIRDKNVLLAFSDPAGAKQVLSFADKNRNLIKSVVAVSDRKHSFYQDFGFPVEDYKTKTSQVWLSSTQTDVLVTGTSVPINIETSLIAEASKHGVESMSFVDHWTNMAKRFKVDNLLVLPNWVCVIDDRARQTAIDDGIPFERILIVGNPYYEYLASWNPNLNREDFLSSIGLPINSKYVLYAPEPISTFSLEKKYGFTEIDGIKMIYEAMQTKLNDQIFIAIKGHPNQNHELFMDYINERGDSRIKYYKDTDINALSYYSECVFGFFSNSLVEASIMKKRISRPLMMINSELIDTLGGLESIKSHGFYDKNLFEDSVKKMLEK